MLQDRRCIPPSHGGHRCNPFSLSFAHQPLPWPLRQKWHLPFGTTEEGEEGERRSEVGCMGGNWEIRQFILCSLLLIKGCQVQRLHSSSSQSLCLCSQQVCVRANPLSRTPGPHSLTSVSSNFILAISKCFLPSAHNQANISLTLKTFP